MTEVRTTESTESIECDKGAEQCWQEILAALQAMIGEASYNTWFTNAALEELKGNKLVIGAANRFVRVWLENNYLATIAEVATPLLGFRPEVEIVISRVQYRQQHQRTHTATGQAASEKSAATDNIPAASHKAERLPLFRRSNHSFENLVVGRCNRFALAAAREAVDAPGTMSPLYFFGGHGLGKTHLLHAICREASAQNPSLKILCISADYFVQSFSAAYVEKRLPEFRTRYERCNLLAIDDFQTLIAGKKTASQKELISILEHFQHNDKQVVIAADRPAHELVGLDPMLASRLSSGVQAKLEGLDETTRLALIRRQAPALSPEVAGLIAQRTGGGVRELEGILKTVSAMARLSEEPVESAQVLDLLAPTNTTEERPTLAVILAAVSGVFQVSATELRGKKRQGSITAARRVFVHLARQLGEASLSEIGLQLGGRSHSTILNILKTAPAAIGAESPLFWERCSSVLQRLGCTRDCHEFFTTQRELFPKE